MIPTYPKGDFPVTDSEIEEITKKRLMELLEKDTLNEYELTLLGMLITLYLGLKE